MERRLTTCADWTSGSEPLNTEDTAAAFDALCGAGKAEVSLAEVQTWFSLLISIAREAREPTQEVCAVTTKAVGVFSIVRRNRNHHDEIIRRTSCDGMSARSSATNPKP